MAPPPASIAQMTEQFTAAPLSALPQAARLGVWQTTVAKEATLSGIGLHSGRQVNMRLLPAAADTGIVFLRTDIEKKRSAYSRFVCQRVRSDLVIENRQSLRPCGRHG